jgi:hypothetical protein
MARMAIFRGGVVWIVCGGEPIRNEALGQGADDGASGGGAVGDRLSVHYGFIFSRSSLHLFVKSSTRYPKFWISFLAINPAFIIIPIDSTGR